MGIRLAVFHPDPPIESHLIFTTTAKPNGNLAPSSIRRNHRVHERRAHLLQIHWVSTRGLLISELFDQVGSVVKLSGLNHSDWTGRMRVRGTNEDCINTAACEDFRPDLKHQRTGNNQGIQPHKSRSVLPIIKNRCTNLARIVNLFGEGFAIAAWDFHTCLRSNIAFCKTSTHSCKSRQGH